MEMGMVEDTWRFSLTRRQMVMAAAGIAGSALVPVPKADAGADAGDLIRQLTGKMPTASDRLHLIMPRFFPNGYTVPLTLMIDCPMTEADHVRHVQVLAPRNPIIKVASFHFAPQRSEPRVSTRIRLAGPQDVLAIAEMSDGSLLMSSTWVDVATNGCT
jgi:sulfur-oxidizing protein SoxY